MALHKLMSLNLSPIRSETAGSDMDIEESFVEDGLGIFRRFENASRSAHTSDRQEIMRTLIDVERAVDFYGTCAHFDLFFQIVGELGTDPAEHVRCALMERFPTLFIDCRQSKHLDPYVDRCLTPLLTSQLSADETVRKAALDVIGVLLEQKLLSQDSLKNLLVPTLFLTLETSCDGDERLGSGKDELRLETCTVICRVLAMHNIDDRQWIFNNFVPKFSYFLQPSPSFHIRKTSVQIFGELARLFKEGFTEVFIVPHLVALTDDSAWGVRKALCEVFVDVAAFVSTKVRREILVPTFIKLLQDKIRWVSIMAGQELGPFIATFADGSLTGLALQNGKVVTTDAEDTVAGRAADDQEYSNLPVGCYLPDRDDYPSSCLRQLSFDDSVREMLMFEKWHRTHDPASLNTSIQSIAASGRCSSSDDLSRFGLDGDEIAIGDEMEDLDESDPLNCSMFNTSDESPDSSNDGRCLDNLLKDPVESLDTGTYSPRRRRSHSPESPDQLSYWRVGIDSLIDESDLTGFDSLSYFGASPLPTASTTHQDGDIIQRRVDLLDRKAVQDSMETLEPSVDSLVVEENMNMDTQSLDQGSTTQAVFVDITHETDAASPNYPSDRTLDDSCEMDISETIHEPAAVIDTSSVGDRTLNFFAEPDKIESDNSSFALISPSCSSSASHLREDDDYRRLKELVPVELVECFVKETEDQADAAHSDYNRHRAHNFPAVAFTLGHRYWAVLRDTYCRLANDAQMRVRSSLAASMHEMAAIVGPQNTYSDLVPVFNKFREDVEEVRSGLLTHLYEFFERIPEACRIEMLHDLPHMLRIDNEANWRFRKEFAKQCAKLCDLYDMESVNRGISGIALTLCSDRVSEVREEAAYLTARILGMMVENEWHEGADELEAKAMPYTEAFVNDIVKGFARSRTFRRRIVFATISEYTLRAHFLDKLQFCALLLDHLTLMANDKVVGVRMAVCRVLKTAGAMPNDHSSVQVEDVLQRLQFDEDADVVRAARLARQCIGTEDLLEAVDTRTRAARISLKEQEYFADLADRVQRLRDKAECDRTAAV